ncbi:hypothetical protein NBRC116598_21080 [Pseudophaeobacter arcticus]|uniref:Uncharacterized protein n=1 Tax=Pseudophaeobacter arcticus TaxID=385492 RepID=A0ABQ0ALD4_9RHOB
MSSDYINFSITCPSCGLKSSEIKLPDNPTDDSIARCKGCDIEFGRYGDIKAEAMKLAKDELSGMFKDTFKGMKGWDIK